MRMRKLAITEPRYRPASIMGNLQLIFRQFGDLVLMALQDMEVVQALRSTHILC